MTREHQSEWPAGARLIPLEQAAGRDPIAIGVERGADLARSIAHAREAVHLRPDLCKAWASLRDGMRETGDLSSALAAAQEAIRLRPQDASAHHVLGLILCEMQEAGRASAAFAEAVRLRPDWAEAHANYGRMLLTLGELNKGWAEHEWRRRLTHSAHELVGAAWSGADPFGRTILLYG